MSKYKIVDYELDDKDNDQIIALLDEVKELLPFVINLTPEERQRGLKIGDKNLAFNTKAIEYAAANPELLPGFINVDEHCNLWQGYQCMGTLLRKVLMLAETIDDTHMALGGRVYRQNLAIYRSVQEASKNNIPGTDTVSADLSKLFAQSVSTADISIDEEGLGVTANTDGEVE